MNTKRMASPFGMLKLCSDCSFCQLFFVTSCANCINILVLGRHFWICWDTGNQNSRYLSLSLFSFLFFLDN